MKGGIALCLAHPNAYTDDNQIEVIGIHHQPNKQSHGAAFKSSQHMLQPATHHSNANYYWLATFTCAVS